MHTQSAPPHVVGQGQNRRPETDTLLADAIVAGRRLVWGLLGGGAVGGGEQVPARCAWSRDWSRRPPGRRPRGWTRARATSPPWEHEHEDHGTPYRPRELADVAVGRVSPRACRSPIWSSRGRSRRSRLVPRGQTAQRAGWVYRRLVTCTASCRFSRLQPGP